MSYLKLYVLTRQDVGYDEYDGKAVIARTAEEATALANLPMLVMRARYGMTLI